ncbi:MAG: hemerythrin domain-containing protein [Thermoplasmata archaeon]
MDAASAPGPSISTEDVLTPIHKALRSMIYQLGARLQTTDFTDRESTDAVLSDLNYEFAAGVPTRCIFCLLHAHAGHEDREGFPKVQPFAPELIQELIADHQDFARRLSKVSELSRRLQGLREAEARIQIGRQINLEVNDFFARYLTHMNREESELIPLMNRYLTDEQLRAIRTAVEASMPPERLAEFHRWILRSLNANELTGLFLAVRKEAPPEALGYLRGLAEASVEPDRWRTVKDRAGL